METEFAKIILNMPYDVYKSFNYVTNHIDAYHNIWKIYYRKSKKSQYIIEVHQWDSINIEINIKGYIVNIKYAPKYLIKIVTRIANYFSILGFPIKVWGL
jgi:hypothetical protein